MLEVGSRMTRTREDISPARGAKQSTKLEKDELSVVESTSYFPPVEESIDRLHRSGWTTGEAAELP